MPVRIKDGGLELEFDSVAEALEYRAQVQGRPSKPEKTRRTKRQTVAQPVTDAGSGWTAFVAALSQRTDPAAVRMKKMLALVKGRGAEGIGWDELAKAMAVEDVQKVYGTFSGLTKSLKGAGIRPDQVIVAGKDKKLRPGRLLVEHEPPTP